MTAGVACKSTVHFSTSFSTTRTLFRTNRNLVFCKGEHAVWVCGKRSALPERDGDGSRPAVQFRVRNLQSRRTANGTKSY
jgi:hypothetical protein